MHRIDDPYLLEFLGLEQYVSNTPPPPPPTSPVAGYHAWYDAQTSVTIDGSNNVLAFPDLSANALTLSASTNMATYAATGLNGKPCVDFVDSTIRYLTSPAFTAYTGTTYTGFFALGWRTPAFPRRGFSMAFNTSTADHANTSAAILVYSDSAVLAGGYRTARRANGVITGSSTRYVITSYFDGTNHNFRINGVAQTPVSSTGAFNVTFYRMGNSTLDTDATTGNQFIGKFGEAIIYQGVLSASDIALNESYLLNRW